jgi:hypothetical protein
MHGTNVKKKIKIKRIYTKDLEKFADIMSYLHICIQSSGNNFLINNYVQYVYSAMVWETNANWQHKKW